MSTPRPRRATRPEGDLGTPAAREKALGELLAALFDADGLRRWLRLDPACTSIARKLPGSSASQEEVIDGAVAAMTRIGFVDQGFFGRLAQDFPRRLADVRRIATAWGILLPTVSAAKKPATPRAATSSSKPSSGAAVGGVTITGGARVSVGGHIVGGDLIVGGQDTPGRKRRPAGG